MTAARIDSKLDTFPKILIDRAGRDGEKVAIREKYLGIWQSWTWTQVLDDVRDIAFGLAALGLKRGDKIAVIGDNRPRLYWSMAAAQALGAVPVPIYQDSIAEEMGFILAHAEVRFAVVEDQEQVDKLLAIGDSLKQLERVVYDDERGMRHYTDKSILSLDSLIERGREDRAAKPAFFDKEVAQGSAEDIAIMLYTSGTTGKPKGVMLTYTNVIATAWSGIEHDKLGENDEIVAYLPMAWVGDHIFSFAQSMCAGFSVSCPESGETVLADLREIGPTYFFSPPRIWENILTTVMVRMEDTSAPKRWMFKKFMAHANRVGVRLTDGTSVGLLDRLLYGLGEILIYGPLKDNLGFSRLRVAYTAGEAIGPEIFDFYRSIGINIKQIYGMTEATALVCGQVDGEVSADSVGKALPGVEIKIADSGEVMFRGPGVFAGYFKNEKATAETKTADGWIRSGDAGYFDGQGQLRIIDRSKDIGQLNDGTMFAPKFLENKLKFSPYVREAVAYGDKRDMATMFINIDLEAVGNWAEKRGLSYSGYADLAARQEVSGLIATEIRRVNIGLGEDEKLKGSQIRRFLILHKELDPDDNELTRTRKVRRSFVAEKYALLIEALYNGSDAVTFKSEVTFEDGRKGVVTADIDIHDVDHAPALADAA